MLRAVLDHADEKGRARLEDVVRSFHSFYLKRGQSGDLVERASARMARAQELSAEEVRGVMLLMPFEKFERRQFLRYDRRDLAMIQFHPTLWRQLTADDRVSIRCLCEEAIRTYYEALPTT